MFENLEERLRSHGLGRLAQAILTSARECVRLKAEESDEDEIPIGSSKLGGQPDLPAGVQWPSWEDGPLSFIAQFNTNELPDFADKGLLPEGTLLSFFWDTDAMDFGPEHKECFRVIATPLGTTLARMPFPAQLSGEGRFTACQLAARKSISLPEWDSAIAESWGMTEDESTAYVEGPYEALMPGDKTGQHHQVLGYAQTIQGDMQHGKPFDEASDWRLLVQIDSDDEAEMNFVDGGRLYFWIRESDLRAGKFDRTWLTVDFY